MYFETIHRLSFEQQAPDPCFIFRLCHIRCIRCECNNHADECDPDTGKCLCQDNTVGDDCSRCEDGFYGNPTAGTKDDCKPCPCVFGKQCILIGSKVKCTDCPEGHQGNTFVNLPFQLPNHVASCGIPRVPNSRKSNKQTRTILYTTKNEQLVVILLKAGLNNVLQLRLLTVVSNIVQHCYTRLRFDSFVSYC